jgi:predicted rRNA methylase YqxC with S4 and FtsJ domains
VGAGGVVRDENVRQEVLASVCAAVPEASRFSVSRPFFSSDGDEDDETAAAAPSSPPPGSSSDPLPPKFVLQGTMESPIRGATSGNVEFLAHFRRG